VGSEHWNTGAAALRGLEADLDAGIHVLDLLGAEVCVASGLQETPGQVLSRTHSCGEGLAEQAAALNQLGQRMGELQQQVEDLGRGHVAGVGVFQCIAPMLLHVKAFVFDLPADTSSLVG